MKKILLACLLMTGLFAVAQVPDHIYKPNIKTVKLYRYGDIYTYPVLTLNSGEQLELHFDDLDGDVKNYYYSYQLCNSDWTPSNLFTFDYIKGFQSQRISTYRNSSIIFTRYTHYQALLPDRNCVPSRSGNYLLKVFLNDDTSKLVFTKRFLVVDNKVTVGGSLAQAFNGQLYRTHQRVNVAVNTAQSKLNIFTQQDLKIVVLQNFTWPTAVSVNQPTIFRGNYFEYTNDALSFPAGREWRWINLTSVRLMSDRMRDLVKGNTRTDVYVKPDSERQSQIYVYYRDNNGLYSVENNDGNNPFWQGEYAYTHFTFIPPGNKQYGGKSIYLFGELTNYELSDSSKMQFNEEKGVYEKTLFLKQGYYNYSYVTVNDAKRPGDSISFDNTEGNFTTTENSYMILVYFRGFGARSDELIGMARVNTLGF